MINLILNTISGFFRLCFLRGSPSALPYSWPLLGAFIFGCLIDTFIPPTKGNVTEIFLAEAVAMTLCAIIIYALLHQKKLSSHFHKTLLAWFGTELIFNLIAKIFFDQSDLISQAGHPGLLVFSIWYLVVKSYILKKSMEVSLATAFLILMGILIAMSVPILLMLTPEAST